MEKTRMVVRKRVEGEVQYNDGDFAEVMTNGIKGIEKNLLLETIQIHCRDTENTPEEFQHRFPVGMWLDILTITEITALPTESTPQNEGDGDEGKSQGPA
jgi:hypothetical protein